MVIVERVFQFLSHQLIGNAVIVALDLDVVVDVHAHRFPLRQDIALGRERLQRRSVEGSIERGTSTFPLAERTLIQAFEKLGQGLVEIGEAEELFVAQYGDQPAFGQEHGGFHFSFIECCQLQAVPIDRLVGSASPIPSIPCAELSTN